MFNRIFVQIKLAICLSTLILVLMACEFTSPASNEPNLFIDLRDKLPKDVAQKAPPNDKGQIHQAIIKDPNNRDGIHLAWSSFIDKPHSFLLSVNASTSPSSNAKITQFSAGAPLNRGTTSAIKEAIPLTLTWNSPADDTGKIQTQSRVIEINSDGTWKEFK